MPNLLKKLRRKLFGLDEQEAAFNRAIADTNELVAHCQHQLDDVKESLNQFHYHQSRALIEVLTQNQPQTVLSCSINDVPLQVSVDILRSYSHCLSHSPKLGLSYYVETHCVTWLAQHLQADDVFLDVGAAYGVVSLPLAAIVGEKGQIYAFEPARRTRESLQTLISRNYLDNIKVVPYAIADETGTAEFIEYSTDNRISWAADTSTLAKDVSPSLENYSTYSVEITTLDQFVAEKNIKPKAIKIDIEGFELYALQGGINTLKNYKPYLCIDI
ncbi:MAG: FkbM family methyltransferase, partial [Microcystaceae cyanobacterium]